jgi:hypothetical protein
MLSDRFLKPSRLLKTSHQTPKKIILVGFDGIIHNHTPSWEDPLELNSTPVKNSFKFLESLVHNDEFKVFIYSPRCKYNGFHEEFIKWCIRYKMPEDIYNRLECTAVLISNHMLIDTTTYFIKDNKSFPTVEEINSFEPHCL